MDEIIQQLAHQIHRHVPVYTDFFAEMHSYLISFRMTAVDGDRLSRSELYELIQSEAKSLYDERRRPNDDIGDEYNVRHWFAISMATVVFRVTGDTSIYNRVFAWNSMVCNQIIATLYNENLPSNKLDHMTWFEIAEKRQ